MIKKQKQKIFVDFCQEYYYLFGVSSQIVLED